MENDIYEKMWEDYAKGKANIYLDYKFQPTHRIGLTNYVRERMIYDFLNPSPEDAVLDAGCASGRQIFSLANQIKEGYGTDVAQAFVEKAREYAANNSVHNCFFQQATLEQLPFPDNKFDKVICAEVLEHVIDKDVALNELIRVLKNNGHLIITVPNFNADGTLWGRLLRMIGLRKFIPIENFTNEEIAKHGDAHVREFSHKTMEDWLKSQGLQVIQKTSASFIDGPFFDFLLKFPLHIAPLRKLIIKFEIYLSKRNLFYGRHLVFLVRKQAYEN